MAEFVLAESVMRYARLAVLIFTSPVFIFSQQNEPEAVFTSDAKLVELHATVSAPDGTLLTNIPESAFRVFEDDVRQEIKVFRHEDAPVSLGLVVDQSASMSDKHARVSAALMTLVAASNPGDEEFVITFNETARLALDFTQNKGKLESALRKIEANGQTALRDALSLGIAHLTRNAKNDRKVLLIVTDGEDNSSVVDLDRLKREARQSGVLIYAIGLLNAGTEREAARAKKDLDTMTFETGGEAFYPAVLGEVDGIARHVAHDLRNQYTIAYSPTNTRQDGTFRRIKLEVTSPADAIVKTRTGYYAASRSDGGDSF
ncbi:MAG TPA: VWA domain-containing protein [Bryobacteraceae bacterium]|nr:VWA domain-containing protein [Bryobacteraceae bacterium]